MGFNNVLVAQSGGPTVAINSSLAGVVSASKRLIGGKIYGSLNGIEGIINKNIIDIGEQLKTKDDLNLLKITPSMALGSCRYKLPPPEDHPEIYQLIVKHLTALSVGYLFYIGGNDSMDTTMKLAHYFTENGIDIKVVGVPKTIDNDLPGTDHSPGFGSAAKFIATCVSEIARDCSVYAVDTVNIIEIMGRDAGWLTASACVPYYLSHNAPDLIYLPEAPFSFEQFIEDVKEVRSRKKHVIAAVSEGVRLADGRYAAEQAQSGKADVFGHRYLAGVGVVLESLINAKIGCKVRSIELNVLQRCASHLASRTDLNEAYDIGAQAVNTAVLGHTGKIMVFQRISNLPYKVEIGFIDVEQAANKENFVPMHWINGKRNFVTKEAFDYILPLIQGRIEPFFLSDFPVYFTFDTSHTVSF